MKLLFQYVQHILMNSLNVRRIWKSCRIMPEKSWNNRSSSNPKMKWIMKISTQEVELIHSLSITYHRVFFIFIVKFENRNGICERPPLNLRFPSWCFEYWVVETGETWSWIVELLMFSCVFTCQVCETLRNEINERAKIFQVGNEN